jgi:hypothetical protein
LAYTVLKLSFLIHPEKRRSIIPLLKGIDKAIGLYFLTLEVHFFLEHEEVTAHVIYRLLQDNKRRVPNNSRKSEMLWSHVPLRYKQLFLR